MVPLNRLCPLSEAPQLPFRCRKCKKVAKINAIPATRSYLNIPQKVSHVHTNIAMSSDMRHLICHRNLYVKAFIYDLINAVDLPVPAIYLNIYGSYINQENETTHCIIVMNVKVIPHG